MLLNTTEACGQVFSWLFSLSLSLQFELLHFLPLRHQLLSHHRHLHRILHRSHPHPQLFSCTPPPQKKNKFKFVSSNFMDYEVKTCVTTEKIKNYTCQLA